MSADPTPLPGWGVIGRTVFLVGVVFTATSSVLGLRDDPSVWWLVVLVVTATVEVAGLLAWLTALFLRRRETGR